MKVSPCSFEVIAHSVEHRSGKQTARHIILISGQAEPVHGLIQMFGGHGEIASICLLRLG